MISDEIIFFTVDITTVGGIERVTLNLANEFIKQGKKVRIVSHFCTNGTPHFNYDNRIHFDYLTKKNYFGVPGGFTRFKNIIKNIYATCKYFKNVTNCFIVAQTFPMAFVLSFTNVFLKNKVYVAEHVCYSYYGKVIRILRNIIYKKYRSVITLTKGDYDFYSEHNIRAKIIPNGVILPFFDNSNILNNRKKIITSVGRLTVQKNFSALISVFSKIHDKYPDWSLNIWGEGEEHQQLQELIDTLNLNDSAFLCGQTDSVYEKLQNTSIFVVSSLYEGFSIVLVEAMATGNACVAYDCPYGPGEIIQNGIDGYLVENQNIDELQKKIELLINDVNKRKVFAQASLESCKRFDINLVSKQWLSLFEE